MDQAIPVDARELYRVRVVVLIELAPQSNEYRQIIYTRPQFDRVVREALAPFPTHPQGYIDVETYKDRALVRLPAKTTEYKETYG